MHVCLDHELLSMLNLRVQTPRVAWKLQDLSYSAQGVFRRWSLNLKKSGGRGTKPYFFKELILDLISAPSQAQPNSHDVPVSDASVPLDSQSSLPASIDTQTETEQLLSLIIPPPPRRRSQFGRLWRVPGE